MITREHYISQVRPFYDSDLIKIIYHYKLRDFLEADNL